MIITYNIVYCLGDEEFDSFCCQFTTMSRVIMVMEHGGYRIASPAWQMKSLGARQQYSQATVNNVLPLMTNSPAFLTRPPNIAKIPPWYQWYCSLIGHHYADLSTWCNTLIRYDKTRKTSGRRLCADREQTFSSKQVSIAAVLYGL